MGEDYTRDLPGYGDLMAVEKYKYFCRRGMFIDYDGFGRPVRDGKMCKAYVIPSRCPGDIPEDATEIIWFNR